MLVISLTRRPRAGHRAARASTATQAMLDGSFDELAEDFDELEWLATDISGRVDERGRTLVRLYRHLHGDSVDIVERHMRAVVAACDAIRREASELRSDTRARRRSPELLAGLTRECHGLADRLRTIAGIAASTIVAAEWQSPSFEHSVTSNAGTRVGRVEPHRDDYRRDRHVDAAIFEAAYVREYVDPPSELDIRALATNCGMSAFTTILAFLQRTNALRGRVVLGASTYHESRDLVRALVPAQRLIEVPDADRHALERAIAHERPSLVILDTLANAPGVTMVDVAAAIAAMRGSAPNARLVLDNTGRSCTFRPFDVVRGTGVRTIVFESLTKFPQFGFDRVTAGIISAERIDTEVLDDLREHLGTNAPDASIAAITTPNRRRLERRLHRIGRNAEVLASRLGEELGRQDVITAVDHPSSPGHPSFETAREVAFRGGWCALRFSPRFDRPAERARFVSLAITEARRRNVSLLAGASFGLDVTRVYATGSASTESFVRIAAGIEHRWDLEMLAASFAAATQRLASNGAAST